MKITHQLSEKGYFVKLSGSFYYRHVNKTHYLENIMDKATYDSLAPFGLSQTNETYAKLDNNIDFIYYENRAREMRALAIKDTVKAVVKAVKHLFNKALPALSLSKLRIA